LQVNDQSIIDAIASYAPDNSRSQIIKKGTNTIILDAYNANPSSMKAALENFSKMEAQHKIVILGDMFELGETSKLEHNTIIKETIKGNYQQKIFIGPRFGEHKNNYDGLFFDSTILCSEYLQSLNKTNLNILIKGSRGMKLETLLNTI
jgi:UDP-N-acetylmuramoyl-tripeptide--D-alanyl-D-alanine ligase